MAKDDWKFKNLSVVSLHLDPKNPRLGRETAARAPKEILQYLFDHDKALEIAESIATRGYFPNEPLLTVVEDGKYVVVEGNRRLAALKALSEPGLIEGKFRNKIERLARGIISPSMIAKVPIVVAPTRRATDRQVAGRHIGTPVLAWQGENRASFILDKLAEGYTNDELKDDLGFSSADIQNARQTRAIADMARSLDLPDEIRAKVDNPRAGLFTTIERVFESSVGRKYLHVKPDAKDGIRGETTKQEFLRGFTKLVTDVALGHQSSRTLNKNENIDAYFRSWDRETLPKKKKGSFVPADIIKGKSVASSSTNAKPQKPKRGKSPASTVLPKDFKIRYGSDRLVDIRRELVKLKRMEFPNAGAVLLRVFFELSVLDYLDRTGDLAKIVTKLEKKNNKPPHGTPTLKQLMPEIKAIAKKKLKPSEANRVEKAVKYDAAAPFTLSDLHAFVHQVADLPSERDIQQFWLRTEPLFRLMLESDPEGVAE